MGKKNVNPMSTVAVGRPSDCFELRILNGVEVWLVEGLGAERRRAFYGATYSYGEPGYAWRDATEDLLANADAPVERVEVHRTIVIVIYKAFTKHECDVALITTGDNNPVIGANG